MVVDFFEVIAFPFHIGYGSFSVGVFVSHSSFLSILFIAALANSL
jgi:hypothetical protein